MSDIKLLKLKTEGRLQKGDSLETPRLGVCSVVTIESVHTITVRSIAGKLFRLSGLSFGPGAKMAST